MLTLKMYFPLGLFILNYHCDYMYIQFTSDLTVECKDFLMLFKIFNSHYFEYYKILNHLLHDLLTY